MLQALRGKKSSLLIKIILVVITIGFSFWGIESYLFTRVDSSVAKVDGTEITQDQYRERFEQERQRILQMAGGTLDASFFQRPEFRRRVLDQLVDEAVLKEANKKLGITITGTDDRRAELVLPSESRVRFRVTSVDVIHSFWIPGFRYKRDLIPGQPTEFDVDVVDHTGVFPNSGACAEFCGVDHALMRFDVRILPGDEFDAWVTANSPDEVAV